MPDQNEPQKIEVDVPVVKTGTVEFMNKAGFTNPAPDKLKRVLQAIKYTLVGLITAVSGTDLFTGKQVKIICFCLGVAILICGGIEVGTGVKSVEQEPKN